VDSQAQVFVELLRQVSPLSSEEPEGIFRLFVRLEEIHNLVLVKDHILALVLPLVSGSMFTCLGKTVGQNVRPSCWMSIFRILFGRG
jgi:hypothetical protein